MNTAIEQFSPYIIKPPGLIRRYLAPVQFRTEILPFRFERKVNHQGLVM